MEEAEKGGWLSLPPPGGGGAIGRRCCFSPRSRQRPSPTTAATVSLSAEDRVSFSYAQDDEKGQTHAAPDGKGGRGDRLHFSLPLSWLGKRRRRKEGQWASLWLVAKPLI